MGSLGPQRPRSYPGARRACPPWTSQPSPSVLSLNAGKRPLLTIVHDGGFVLSMLGSFNLGVLTEQLFFRPKEGTAHEYKTFSDETNIR